MHFCYFRKFQLLLSIQSCKRFFFVFLYPNLFITQWFIFIYCFLYVPPLFNAFPVDLSIPNQICWIWKLSLCYNRTKCVYSLINIVASVSEENLTLAVIVWWIAYISSKQLNQAKHRQDFCICIHLSARAVLVNLKMQYLQTFSLFDSLNCLSSWLTISTFNLIQKFQIDWNGNSHCATTTETMHIY